MRHVSLYQSTGSFAENKDLARNIRAEVLAPLLQKGETVVLDFSGVESATQSFIHALISELIREYGSDFFDKVSFKNCNDTVKKVVEIVADYMQQTD